VGEKFGQERDWIWRGWRIRYTYVRASQANAIAPPLILIHGFGMAIGHWRHNLQPLARERTVYALDLLGFGASQKVAAPYSTSELWADQVYDFWRTLVQRPAVLVGNSIGSLVAMGVAARYPDAVKGLVFVNLPDASVLGPPNPWQRVLRQMIQPMEILVKAILTSPPIFVPFFAVIRQPNLLHLWLKQAYVNHAVITHDLVRIAAEPTLDRGATSALRSMVHSNMGGRKLKAREILPHLQIPILLLWGKQDALVPPRLARRFAQISPTMELIELDQAGHCPHDEYPEVVNLILLDWLQRFGH